MTNAEFEAPPRWAGASVARIDAAQSPSRQRRVFHGSPVPLLMVDEKQRYRCANAAARLSIRRTLEELRRGRVGDLASRAFRPVIENAWSDLVQYGRITGRSELGGPGGSPIEICYYVAALRLPGWYLAAFAPADWPEDELLVDWEQVAAPAPTLSQREVGVLALVADGFTTARIAQELILSPATIKTHLDHIYDKLGVRDRAGAVAAGMRRGLIS